ncbi:MAG: hypothetical protein KAF91_04090 [Nostoc sp. TH1S01]|nr:hypothetical protein [Nostoc sp. TH1S01]
MVETQLNRVSTFIFAPSPNEFLAKQEKIGFLLVWLLLKSLSSFIHILHLAPTNGIRGYTNEVRLRGLTQYQGFGTRAGGETSAAGGFPSAGDWR